ncbi:MAG: hypothetical protein IKR11_12430 [Solobacterium sp.]|nr:hypothetical protein [Solobacterium sp.]
MSDTMNIILIASFSVLSVIMLVRWFLNRGKVMIQDQQWSYIRILFLIVGLLSILSFVTSNNSFLDYVRLTVMVIAVSAYMIVRDGVGEDGLVSGGKFYPWEIVRAYDYKELKNVVEVYFTVDSTNEKKPDEYTTKVLDFSNESKDILMRFLEINLGRKYTRMKKKTK